MLCCCAVCCCVAQVADGSELEDESVSYEWRIVWASEPSAFLSAAAVSQLTTVRLHGPYFLCVMD